jgi:TRAP transporter 4TM/12TM fusion protein
MEGRAARVAGAAAAVLAAALVLVSVAWVLGLQRRLGLILYGEQFLGAVLTLATGALFLRDAARARRPPRALLDAALGAGALAGGAWVTAAYPRLLEDVSYDPAAGAAPAALVVLAVLEGLRRTAGTGITALVAAFVLYGLFGDALPGPLAARSVAPDRLATQLAFDTNALVGGPLQVAATVVVVFVLFGAVLNRVGGGAFFTDLALALMGRFRGGSAKISIVASALFGSISGSAVGNVMTTGVVTVPMMKRGGYRPETAGAIEAVASTGGQLMPPVMGAAAFLMAEFLRVPYAEVMLAALLPSILYYLALFLQADLEAARAGIRAVDPRDVPPVRRTLAAGWVFAIPLALLVWMLLSGRFEAEVAGLAAVAVLVALAFVPRPGAVRPGARALAGSLAEAGALSIDVIMITAAAGLIIGVLNVTGLGFALTLALVQLGGGSLPALLLIAALISVVLGMGMPTVAVYVILASLVAPSLVELGVEPMAAHLFVLYFGVMSMVTPPVAVAAFAAASLGGASPVRTGLEAMRLGWTAYIVPFLFVASPSLLLFGSWDRIALDLATAVVGVGLVTAGSVGHAVGPLGPARRVAAAAAGLGLLVPSAAFPGAGLLNLAAAALALALAAAELAPALRRRRA